MFNSGSLLRAGPVPVLVLLVAGIFSGRLT